MSASTEKKLRAQARAEGTDKKTLAAQEAELKAKKTKRWTIIAVVAVVVFVAAVLLLNSSLVYRQTSALTVGDKSFSPAEVNYVYSSDYQNFVSMYGDYASMFGLDTSYGLAGLSSQDCYMAEEGSTWRDYFLGTTKESLKQYYALNKVADENGITLSEDDQATLDSEITALESSASYYGYSNGNAMASAYYGKGVNMDVAREMMEYTYRAQLAYSDYSESIEVTDAEIEAEYPSVEVRHILINAVADENGEYTDEALAEAKAKAEDILAEWKAGDATEDSFAALAEQYSEDEGSNTNGGLYDSVIEGSTVEEFDAFCFDESRQSGDTAIVFGDNGSYQGYHVMYYVGKGDPANNETGRDYILDEKLSSWLDGLVENVETSETFWIRLVGKT